MQALDYNPLLIGRDFTWARLICQGAGEDCREAHLLVKDSWRDFSSLRGIIMPMFTIRPARESDFPAIRALINQVQINPMNLDWQRFVVAVTPDDILIGCGQIKPHRDGSDELASIAVSPEWRKRGVARAIILTLLESHPGKLYLTCRANLGQFYEKFGFRSLAENEMPPYYRNIRRLFKAFTRITRAPDDLLVMLRDG